MKLKPLILIFALFLLSLNIVNAIPKCDGGIPCVGWNYNASRNSSDYKFYVNYAEHTELNFSLFQLHGNTPYNVQNGFLNISSTKDDAVNQRFTEAIFTGKLAPIFTTDDCVSVNFSSKRHGDNSNPFPIAFHDSLPANGTTTRVDLFGEDISIGLGAGAGPDEYLNARANDASFEQVIQSVQDDVVFNVTFGITSANTFGWWWNGSDTNNASYTFGTATNFNLTMQAQSKDDEFRIYSIRVFPCSTGVPNRDPNPAAPPPSDPGLALFTLTAKDEFDAAAINNISVRLFNSSWEVNLSTRNGTILLLNNTLGSGNDMLRFNSSYYNFTFGSNESGGYFNRTFTKINITDSGSFQGSIFQSLIYVNATEVISNAQLLNIGARVNGSSLVNLSNSTGYATLMVRAGTYNLTINSTPYINRSFAINISVLQIKNFSFELGRIKLILNATTVTTGDSIASFSSRLNKTDSPYQNYSNNQSTDTGTIIYYLINGTYGIKFQSNDYADQFVSLKLNDTDSLWNHTFQVYTTNSVNITFYDELVGKSMRFNESPVRFEFVSDVYSANFSTQNGSFFIDLLTPADYRISYVTDKYKKRDFFFTLVNRSNNVIDLYLLSLGNSTDVTFQIKDESGNFLKDATIKLKRYYVAESGYITIAMGKTNAEGKSILDVDFDDAYYELLATYKDFSTVNLGSKIFTTTITLKINTLSDPFAKIDKTNRIISYINFNNLTQTFSFFFSDPDGLTRTGTLEVLVGDSVVCSTASSSSSATLLCQYNSTNSSSRVYAVGYIDGSKIPVAILELATKIQAEAKALFGSSGLFYTIIFAGSVAGLGIFSIAVSVILFLAGLIGMIFMGISYVSTTIYILIVIMGLLVVWRVRS